MPCCARGANFQAPRGEADKPEPSSYSYAMDTAHEPGFCRDCLTPAEPADSRCRACKSPRLLRHPELHQLSIAHIDCDAFYASVEKRDHPELHDKPVIVGGAVRGVVSTACYIARIRGVRSAMPMTRALKLCPDAVVIKPNMSKYVEVSREIRKLMLELTPLVQPISIDEAFMDLSGTQRLHGATPALSLARLIFRIEKDIGVTASVGLSCNKFLAKLASDSQKPRGFSVIGEAEALQVLAPKPVTAIWGVGAATQAVLAKRGIATIGQLQQMERDQLTRAFGQLGTRLYYLSRGEDLRDVHTEDVNKSVSAETTFNDDITDYAELEAWLWKLSQRVSRRAKQDGVTGKTITLKLKTPKFETRTRAISITDGTNLAHVIFEAGQTLLKKEAHGEAFRLIGIGISRLEEGETSQAQEFDVKHFAMTKAEIAMDKIRQKFGNDAVDRGIALKGRDND